MKKEQSLLEVAEAGIILHRVAEAFEEIGEKAAWIGYAGAEAEWKPPMDLKRLAVRAEKQAQKEVVLRWKKDRPKLVKIAEAWKKDAEEMEKLVRQMEEGENLEFFRGENLEIMRGNAKRAQENAKRAEERAKRPPSFEERAQERAGRLSPSAADDYFNPLEELQDAVEALRGLSVGVCTKGTAKTMQGEHLLLKTKRMKELFGDLFERETDADRERMERNSLPPFRAVAWRFSVFCKKCAVLSNCRGNELWTRAILDAKAAARENSLRASLAKVKGDKKAYRKWKQKAKADIDGARMLKAYSLVYMEGMTVEEAAEEMKLSLRTVESLLHKARAVTGAERRKGGRRKSVEADPLKGIEEAENEGSAARWQEEEGGFYQTIEDALDGGADENGEWV